MTTQFNDLKAVYEDIKDTCNHFKYEAYDDIGEDKPVMSLSVVFPNFRFENSKFEVGNNELYFWQGEDCYSSELSLHNVVKVEKTDDLGVNIFRYKFWLKDKEEPYCMMAFGEYED